MKIVYVVVICVTIIAVAWLAEDEYRLESETTLNSGGEFSDGNTRNRLRGNSMSGSRSVDFPPRRSTTPEVKLSSSVVPDQYGLNSDITVDPQPAIVPDTSPTVQSKGGFLDPDDISQRDTAIAARDTGKYLDPDSSSDSYASVVIQDHGIFLDPDEKIPAHFSSTSEDIGSFLDPENLGDAGGTYTSEVQDTGDFLDPAAI